MKWHQWTFVLGLMSFGVLVGISGCKTGGKSGGGGFRLGGIKTGNASLDRAFSIGGSAIKVGQAHAEANKEFTDRQLYFVGRSASANVIAKNGVVDTEAATAYLNLVGQSLARFSNRPEVHNGYRFAILNSDHVNAYATPGSYIFVSKGLLKMASSEDELAAVIAHELAHIEQRHPVKTIKQSLGTTFWLTLAAEGAKQSGKRNLKQVVEGHGKMVGALAQTLSEKGYSRDSEFEADVSALGILSRAGYDPSAMIRVLEKMKTKYRRGGLGFDKTHPSPQDRIAKLRPRVSGAAKPVPTARRSRFNQAMAGIRG